MPVKLSVVRNHLKLIHASLTPTAGLFLEWSIDMRSLCKIEAVYAGPQPISTPRSRLDVPRSIPSAFSTDPVRRPYMDMVRIVSRVRLDSKGRMKRRACCPGLTGGVLGYSAEARYRGNETTPWLLAPMCFACTFGECDANLRSRLFDLRVP